MNDYAWHDKCLLGSIVLHPDCRVTDLFFALMCDVLDISLTKISIDAQISFA